MITSGVFEDGGLLSEETQLLNERNKCYLLIV